MPLDRETMQAYQKRWQAVEEVEHAERQSASIAERWRRLNSLLRLAVALGLEPQHDESEIEVVRYRWNRLRALYLAEKEDASH